MPFHRKTGRVQEGENPQSEVWIPVSLVLGSKKELGLGPQRGLSRAGVAEEGTLLASLGSEESAWEGPLPWPQRLR